MDCIMNYDYVLQMCYCAPAEIQYMSLSYFTKIQMLGLFGWQKNKKKETNYKKK